MNLSEYEQEALVTWHQLLENISPGLVYLSLGLASECGEVAGKLAKIVRDDNSRIDCAKRDAILQEIGDCAWFLAVLSSELGSSFEEVCKMNIAKLRDRQARQVLGGSGDNR